MADYYTNFSVVLPLTKEQQEYAFEIAKQVEEHWTKELPTDFPKALSDALENWSFETEITEHGLWLNSSSGGQDAACVFIQHLLQKFSFAEGVTFEWSHDCSKPRTDGFGGGAAFVTTDQIKNFTTSEWLQQVIGKRKHRFNPDTLCCTKCGKHSDAVESTICLQ
jgi:hypothetical protein